VKFQNGIIYKRIVKLLTNILGHLSLTLAGNYLCIWQVTLSNKVLHTNFHSRWP